MEGGREPPDEPKDDWTTTTSSHIGQVNRVNNFMIAYMYFYKIKKNTDTYSNHVEIILYLFSFLKINLNKSCTTSHSLKLGQVLETKAQN
jgi:hypothetical protein